MQKLEEKFRKAGVDLIVLKHPIRKGRGMEDIFQIDIQRNVRGLIRREAFRIYPGHSDNLVQVRGVDAKLKQLVLFVREPVREFDNVIKLTPRNTFQRVKDEALARRPRPVKIFRSGDEAHVIMRTTEGNRYFLMGVDERQLFIAQLTASANTVDEARKLLGKTVQFADGKRKGSSLDRQGEWFFLETDEVTKQKVENLLRQTRLAIHRKASIGRLFNRVGTPHIADELVLLPGTLQQVGADPKKLLRNRVFVRGSIRHKDHKTVRFSNWREVIANNEVAAVGQFSSPSGVFWVD